MTEFSQISYKHFQDESYAESPIIRFMYNDAIQQLDMVIDYAADVLSEYFEHIARGNDPKSFRRTGADFRLLRFEGIRSFKFTSILEVFNKTAISIAPPESWDDFEKSLIHSHPRLLTQLECHKHSHSFNIEMSIDSTGHFSWDCTTVHVRKRVAIIDRDVSLHPRYIDSQTLEEVDPKNPFPQEILKFR